MPTYFSVGADVLRPSDEEPVWTTHRGGALEAFFWIIIVVGFVAAAIAALVNLRKGVGHRLLAFRLGVLVVTGAVLGGILRAHHALTLAEEAGFVIGLSGWALVWGGFSWLTYLAIEPSMRRFSPLTIRSWASMLSGKLDATIGRDLLLAACAGAATAGFSLLRIVVVPDRRDEMVLRPALESLRSWRHLAFVINFNVLDSIEFALYGALLIVVGTRVLRSERGAAAAVIILGVPLTVGGMPQTLLDGLGALATMTIVVAVFVRVGLFAATTTLFVERLLTRLPIDLRPGSWLFSRSVVVVSIVIGLVLAGVILSQRQAPTSEREFQRV